MSRSSDHKALLEQEQYQQLASQLAELGGDAQRVLDRLFHKLVAAKNYEGIFILMKLGVNLVENFSKLDQKNQEKFIAGFTVLDELAIDNKLTSAGIQNSDLNLSAIINKLRAQSESHKEELEALIKNIKFTKDHREIIGEKEDNFTKNNRKIVKKKKNNPDVYRGITASHQQALDDLYRKIKISPEIPPKILKNLIREKDYRAIQYLVRLGADITPAFNQLDITMQANLLIGLASHTSSKKNISAATQRKFYEKFIDIKKDELENENMELCVKLEEEKSLLAFSEKELAAARLSGDDQEILIEMKLYHEDEVASLEKKIEKINHDLSFFENSVNEKNTILTRLIATCQEPNALLSKIAANLNHPDDMRLKKRLEMAFQYIEDASEIVDIVRREDTYSANRDDSEIFTNRDVEISNDSDDNLSDIAIDIYESSSETKDVKHVTLEETIQQSLDTSHSFQSKEDRFQVMKQAIQSALGNYQKVERVGVGAPSHGITQYQAIAIAINAASNIHQLQDVFLTYQDDFNSPNSHTGQALAKARHEKNAQMLKLLKSLNANDISGSTFCNTQDDKDVLLRFAAKEGLAEAVKILVDNGADVNAINRDGNTALHLASYYGESMCQKILIQKGADGKIKNSKGKTAKQCQNLAIKKSPGANLLNKAFHRKHSNPMLGAAAKISHGIHSVSDAAKETARKFFLKK